MNYYPRKSPPMVPSSRDAIAQLKSWTFFLSINTLRDLLEDLLNTLNLNKTSHLFNTSTRSLLWVFSNFLQSRLNFIVSTLSQDSPFATKLSQHQSLWNLWIKFETLNLILLSVCLFVIVPFVYCFHFHLVYIYIVLFCVFCNYFCIFFCFFVVAAFLISLAIKVVSIHCFFGK